MSKSFSSPKGLIEILDDPKKIAKNIKSAVTDADGDIRFDRAAKPGVSNLLTIYSALTGQAVESIVQDYAGKGYGHLKVDLAELVVEYLTPVRESALHWIESPDKLDAVLADGAQKASVIAQATLARLYDRVGVLAPASTKG